MNTLRSIESETETHHSSLRLRRLNPLLISISSSSVEVSSTFIPTSVRWLSTCSKAVSPRAGLRGTGSLLRQIR